MFAGTRRWDCWSCTSWPSLWHPWAWDWIHRWSDRKACGECHHGECVCTGGQWRWHACNHGRDCWSSEGWLSSANMGWHDCTGRMPGETEDHCKRLGIACPMEGWIIELGEVEGFEGFKPDWSSQTCGGQLDCEWTSICMVGSTSAVQMEPDHVKGEVQVLEDDSQVWRAVATFSWRGLADWCRCEDWLLAEGLEQGNVKGEGSLAMARWLCSQWHVKWKVQGLCQTPRDWMSRCIRRSHDVWAEGSFCHWRTHDRSSIIDCLLKCCFERQCAAWLPDCCIEQCRHPCLWLTECMLECTLHGEDMVWR